MKDGYEDKIRELHREIKSLQHSLKIAERENDSMKDMIPDRERKINELEDALRKSKRK